MDNEHCLSLFCISVISYAMQTTELAMVIVYFNLKWKLYQQNRVKWKKKRNCYGTMHISRIYEMINNIIVHFNTYKII